MIAKNMRIVRQEVFSEIKIPVIVLATSCSTWDSVFNTKCTECNTIITAGCEHMRKESSLNGFKKQNNLLYKKTA